MPTSDSIFRDYKPAEAERSDRSAGDRLRHRQKVRESIRENIADIIAEESIIGKNKDRVIKVPLRGIKEYRFVFGENAPGAGTGDGNAQEGQVVGKAGQQPGQGNEGQGGDKPGVDSTRPTSPSRSSSTSCSRTSSCPTSSARRYAR